VIRQRRGTARAARTGPPGDAVRVEGNHLLTGPGSRCAVVESSDFDVTALDDARRGAVVAAFSRLLRTLESHLQIVVQVRPWVERTSPVTAGAATGRTVCDRLRAAEEAHREDTLRRRRAFRRTLLFVPAVDAGTGAAAADLDRAVAAVVETVRAAGATATVLEGATLRERLRESWSGASTGTDGDPLIRPPWRAWPRQAATGGVQVRGFRLQRLPGTAVEAGWLAPLLLARAECDIALHLEPTPLGEAMSRLSRRLRDLRADQLVEADRDTVADAGVEAGVDGALDLRGRLARNEGRSLRLGVIGLARAHGPAELDQAAEAVRVAFAATLAGCEPTHFEHLGAAMSVWPLGRDHLGGGKLVDSAALATCVPWVEAGCDDPGGYPLGCSLATGAPVRLDPFDTGRHANANVAVLAASGQGKSYTLGALVLAAAARRRGSIVIDPEGEHERLVRALGGDYLQLAPGCGAALNVFEAGAGDEGEPARRAEVVGAVVDLVNVLCGGALDEVERARVDAAATAALAAAAGRGRPALLGDCLEQLGDGTPRVATVLTRFCGGPLGELFNRPTSLRLRTPVAGISLRDLRDELVPAATLIVAEWLWSLVRRQRRERHLVFDEVGLLCAHAPLRRLLTQLARRCRKYGVSLVVATQNAGDLLATEEGTVVATNPSVILLGGHRGAETARMQSAYGLTDAQRRSLEAAARGDFLLLAGGRRLGIHVEVPPLQHALLTADTARG
jgi:Helicase HerA, central domain